MNVTPDKSENSPEPRLSELCVNLESKFMNMQELSKAESMRVYARIRPMLSSEVEAGYKRCIRIIDDHIVRAVVPASSAKYKMSSHLSQDIIEDFTFTSAYGPETGQFVFFEECMMDTMLNFIEGQNSLMFSYGTTGSGKTYTLQGNPDTPGIIPLSLHLFFASIEGQLLDRVVVKPDKFSDVIALNDNEIKREMEIKEQLLSAYNQEEWSFRNSSSTKSFAMTLCDTFSEKFEGEGRQTTLGSEDMAQAQAATSMKELSKMSAAQQTGYCSVWISFVEIYNENIYDLLQPNVNQRTKLNLGEDKNGDVYVKGLREVPVSNSYEALKLLNFGQRNLKIASTKLNYQSSRSHCIFTIKVIRIPDPNNMIYAKVNRLSFCDLAGSERAAKSQTTGLRLKEAGCINTSLLVLGRCLEQLRLKPSLRDKKLIPFRERKLTRLFSGFFTGRGKAVMITNASPSELTFDETLHVLRFSAVAKELIINDSYIATASSALQSITNIWTNAKNSKDISNATDKSISFEDSVEEVIQEKDELIEKLLDLAESLKSNLEREKKEKAELEMKIREVVCEEYSEYSDELLANQKEMFEKERNTLKEIYRKRILALEKMYEDIIKEEKVDESESSGDEASDGDFEIIQTQNIKTSEVDENIFKNEFTKNAGFITESTDLENITEESKRTKDELQKTVDYSLSLETEVESLRKMFEDTKLQLENILKENDEMKRELDAYKIDCLAYKTDIDGLLKEKATLEDDIKSLTEDLAAVLREKEAMHEKLTESNNKVASYSDEIQNLLQRINELIRIQEESDMKYEMSIDEANIKIEKANEKLSAACDELEEERMNRMKLEVLVSTMEKDISELQSVEQNSILTKNVLSKELDDLKSENTELKEKLEIAESSASCYSQTVSELQVEIEELNKTHSETVEKLTNSVKQHEIDAKEAELVLKSVNKTLDNALVVTEEQKKELATLKTKYASLENDITELQNVKADIEGKWESASKELEIEQNKNNFENAELIERIEKLTEVYDSIKSECLKYKNEIDVLNETNVTLEAKLSSLSSELEIEQSKNNSENAELIEGTEKLTDEYDNIKSECLKYKNEIDVLNETNVTLEGKLSSLSSELESEKVLHIQELDAVRSKLDETLNIVDKQKKEMEDLMNEISSNKKQIAELQALNKELNDKLNSETESEILASKEELITKLNEAELTINKQKNELENLETVNENEIAELKKLNKELEHKITSQASQFESEKMSHSQELDALKNKLDEALCMIDKQKKKMEDIMNEMNSNKNQIAELEAFKKEIDENIKPQSESENMVHTEELMSKLHEAELTISQQKAELESLETVSKNELAELKKLNEELESKITSQASHSDTVHGLVEVLENCERQASLKIKMIHSDLEKFKQEFETNSADQKKEYDTLLELIGILEKCEALASSRIKRFHVNSIKQVEQMMDLEACVKAKDKAIEVVITDYNALQKQFKEFQTTSKKQLQTEKQEKQQFAATINDMKGKQSSMMKENESLKSQLTKLQADKDKLQDENKTLKLEKANKKNEKSKEKGHREATKEKSKEQKNENEIAKEVQNENSTAKTDTKASMKNEEISKKRSGSGGRMTYEGGNFENESAKKLEEKPAEEKVQERNISRKKKNQGEKRKTNQTIAKSEYVAEDKRQKTKIYEETDENSNTESNKKEKRTGRRHLRCMENVVDEMNLVQMKDSDSGKTKSSKRKQQEETEEKSFEKNTKKLKLHDMNDTENVSKPENLRVKLLKASVVLNDIALPTYSPKMTRGRRRLIQAKENITVNKGSPRTVRS